jgi:hypothetical protein
MDLNKLVIGIIKSNYIKDCITKNNTQFTYEEQITIILNSTEELSTKRNLLQLYLESEDVKNNLRKDYISDIQKIVNEIGKINEYIYGEDDNIVLIYKNDTGLYCSRKLSTLLEKIKEQIDGRCIEVGIYDVSSVEEIGYIIVDEDSKVEKYSLANEVDSELYNYFINIPNDLHIGDVVSTVDSDSKFIVVSNPIAPNKFKGNLNYDDASVVVIPINLLSIDKDYKEQIEKIYTDRINNIENPCAKPDIIMEYYDTINILNIQK